MKLTRQTLTRKNDGNGAGIPIKFEFAFGKYGLFAGYWRVFYREIR